MWAGEEEGDFQVRFLERTLAHASGDPPNNKGIRQTKGYTKGIDELTTDPGGCDSAGRTAFSGLSQQQKPLFPSLDFNIIRPVPLKWLMLLKAMLTLRGTEGSQHATSSNNNFRPADHLPLVAAVCNTHCLDAHKFHADRSYSAPTAAFSDSISTACDPSARKS